MKWLLVLALLAPATGFTQTRPAPKKARPASKKAPAAVRPPAGKWPIESVKVEGAPDYPSDRVLAVAGLKIGQIAGKDEFEAAHDRLLATGVFQTVGYRFEPGPNGKGYAATFQVSEIVPILPVRFEDLGVGDGELEAVLRGKDPLFVKGRLAATKAVIDRYTEWIQEYLASKNLDSNILAGVSPFSKEAALVFRPAKAYPVVAEVAFEGNQVVPEDALRQAVSGAAIGAPYTEEHFQEILDSSVRPVYENRGRLRVAFTKLRAEPAKGVQGLRVLVAVHEGDAYRLGKVALTGSTSLREEELLKAGEFKTGDIFNADKVKGGCESIRGVLRRAGYLEAKVAPERDIHDDSKTADVNVGIDAGPRYSMGALTVIGLDLTATAELNRIWAIKEGKPFNPDYPDLFLRRIREQGLFDNLGTTKSSVELDKKEHTASVKLTFEGVNQMPPGGAPRKRMP